MALRIVANRPDPAVVTLPWHLPLEEWTEHVVPLPRGLSRHVVRIIRVGEATYAVKETQEEMAFREYRLLRDLQRLGLPAVVAQAVVTGRVDADGEPLPSALITRHLRFSLPYRSLFSHGTTAEQIPSLVDAMVVLLVRLHLAGFFWGDVSLSNVLFRRDAGAFAAYLVDAETGELRSQLSPAMREYDLTVGTENIFAELLDLQASDEVYAEMQAHEIVDLLQERYDALWDELTSDEEFSGHELWRIEQRIERLNDLGFDVEELDIVTDWPADRVRIQPQVVELGHHQRELQSLTGLFVEDNQARRLLNDLASFTAHFDLGREDRHLVANRWLTEIYEPIMAMIPADARASSSRPRSSTRSWSTGGTSPSAPGRRSRSSTPRATTSPPCSPRSPRRRSPPPRPSGPASTWSPSRERPGRARRTRSPRSGRRSGAAPAAGRPAGRRGR